VLVVDHPSVPALPTNLIDQRLEIECHVRILGTERYPYPRKALAERNSIDVDELGIVTSADARLIGRAFRIRKHLRPDAQYSLSATQ
jgi:hypothetical protein